MTKTNLETISIDDLDTACGGANSVEGKGNIGIDVIGKAKVGIQGEYKSTQSDYASCLKAMVGVGAKPADIAATCGKPGGAK